MYCIWLKIDNTLPLFELKGTYLTRTEARKAAQDSLRSAQVRIVRVQDKGKPIKAIVSVRSTR